MTRRNDLREKPQDVPRGIRHDFYACSSSRDRVDVGNPDEAMKAQFVVQLGADIDLARLQR
jgi:hypothetical protein